MFGLLTATAARARTCLAFTIFATVVHLVPPERNIFRETRSIWLAPTEFRDSLSRARFCRAFPF